MKVLDVKLDETSVKFYDDFTENSCNENNLNVLEQMLYLAISSFILVK